MFGRKPDPVPFIGPDPADIPKWKIVPVIGGYKIGTYSWFSINGMADDEGYSYHACDPVFPTVEDAQRTIDHLSQPPIYRP